jgi:hypothetical protein
MAPYRPRFGVFHLLFVTGLALASYYGWAWMELPVYTEADIEESVQLNLAIELSQRGPHLQPSPEGLERLGTRIRQEIEGRIQQERETVQRRFGIGLLLLVVGLSRLLADALSGRRPAAP